MRSKFHGRRHALGRPHRRGGLSIRALNIERLYRRRRGVFGGRRRVNRRRIGGWCVLQRCRHRLYDRLRSGGFVVLRHIGMVFAGRFGGRHPRRFRHDVRRRNRSERNRNRLGGHVLRRSLCLRLYRGRRRGRVFRHRRRQRNVRSPFGLTRRHRRRRIGRTFRHSHIHGRDIGDGGGRPPILRRILGRIRQRITGRRDCRDFGSVRWVLFRRDIRLVDGGHHLVRNFLKRWKRGEDIREQFVGWRGGRREFVQGSKPLLPQ
ncbi:MAG: hypothetical protein B7Z30_11880, partial [Rhizobiales bacterium 12-68-15]